jgi:hypothetical protein
MNGTDPWVSDEKYAFPDAVMLVVDALVVFTEEIERLLIVAEEIVVVAKYAYPELVKLVVDAFPNVV